MNIRIERSQKHGMMPPSDQLGFGTVFTDHMFLMDYTDQAGWRALWPNQHFSGGKRAALRDGGF